MTTMWKVRHTAERAVLQCRGEEVAKLDLGKLSREDISILGTILLLGEAEYLKALAEKAIKEL